jgi:hypothetical protein
MLMPSAATHVRCIATAATAKLVARRMAVPEHELLVRLRDLRRLPAWWSGPPERPTSRPDRAPNKATEEKETCS